MNAMTGRDALNFNGKRVLIVDDSPSIRELLREMLYDAGFDRVWCAGDGAKALSVLNENKVDAILCDSVMEPVDGLTVIRNLRATDGDNADAPVLLVTGHAERGLVESARKAGVNGILVKPVARGLLLDRLQALLTPAAPRKAVPDNDSVVWDTAS